MMPLENNISLIVETLDCVPASESSTGSLRPSFSTPELICLSAQDVKSGTTTNLAENSSGAWVTGS